jgi:hypothetical protein
VVYFVPKNVQCQGLTPRVVSFMPSGLPPQRLDVQLKERHNIFQYKDSKQQYG